MLSLATRAALTSLPCPTGPKALRELWTASTYDAVVRPPPTEGDGSWPPTAVYVIPVPIKVGMFNTREQVITVELDMQVYWTDSRVAFNSSCAAAGYLQARDWSNGEVVDLRNFTGEYAHELGDFEQDPRGLVWAPRLVVDNLRASGERAQQQLSNHRFI
eukprot:4285512-Prymnesium_polylepis.1